MGAAIHVVYVGGAGRSGSTLLARILGQAPGWVAVGELRHFLGHGCLRLPEDVLCGCGEPFARCPFWTEVGAKLAAELPQLRLEEVASLARRVDRIRYLPAIYAPWKTPRFASDLRRFSALLVALYRAVLAVSGARVVVDDSKDLSLLYLLARLPEVDLSVVHLVRDSRATAYSWTKQKRRPEFAESQRYMDRYSPTRSAAEWWYRNVGVELVRPLVRRHVTVRYEDLVERPADEVGGLLEGLGLPIPPRAPAIQRRAIDLRGDHLVWGNPFRFQHGRVELRLDDAWKRHLPRGSRRWMIMLTWPLLWRYGYLSTG